MRHAIIILGMIVAGPAAAQVASAATDGPTVHRLSPEDAAAAVDAGAERNRAADALALARGDPALALPGELGERRDRKIHGEIGAGFGSNGGREVFGEVGAPIGDNASATLGYDYTQFGRTRYRNR